MKRRLMLWTVSGVVTLAVVALVWGGLFGGRPLKVAHNNMLYIDRDDTADSVHYKLEKNFGMTSFAGLKLLEQLRDYRVRTGAYQMTASLSVVDLYRMLSRGHQSPVELVVPNVRTVPKAIGIMARQVMADSAEIARAVFDSTTMAQMGFDRNTLPALFIPNTYEVYWNMSGEALVKRLKKEYTRYWNARRRDKAASMGLTPVEVSVLASIVDEETAANAEKPMIAGLYYNRLQRGMLLQADPTVKFAMNDFTLKRILFKHLETDSPYNTYKYAGLPPGPIRIPSVQGLESVLNYAHHKYLYMCAKEDFSGTHNFAVTLGQHSANARKYQSALNRLLRKK